MKKFFLLVLPVLVCAACTSKSDYCQVGTTERDTLMNVPCVVYLPYQYAERAQNDRIVFPVLYLQHGMYGCEDDWTEQGFLLRHMDSLLQAGAVKEMVVIMPDNCPRRPTWEEEKANATNGEWENNFAEFMAEAESRYSISTEPSQRAIAGLSMGGYHTMQVSYVLDGRFDYVGMFSPATFEHHAPSSPELFWIAIGKDDFLYESLQDYRRWLDENHIEYMYYESAGAHTWDNWQDYLCRFLPRLFKQ